MTEAEQDYSVEDTSIDWESLFLHMAQLMSLKSKDPSTKVGAVIAHNNIPVSVGFNGFPRGIRECESTKCALHGDEKNILDSHRWKRPEKYQRAEHAERNAIYNAARLGIKLEGSTLFCTHLPCDACARAIIQAGIKRVVYNRSNKWQRLGKGESSQPTRDACMDMLEEAGVEFCGVYPKVNLQFVPIPTQRSNHDC